MLLICILLNTTFFNANNKISAKYDPALKHLRFRSRIVWLLTR